MHSKLFGKLVTALFVAGTSVSGLTTPIVSAATSPSHSVHARHLLWREQARKGNVRLTKYAALGGGRFIRRHNPASVIHVDFTLPLYHHAALDHLIQIEAKTHRYPSREYIYRHFSPPAAQFAALSNWIEKSGLRTVYSSPDRLMISVAGRTSHIENLLRTHINDYRAPDGGTFYANTRAPLVPANLGLQTVVGLNTRAQFHTNEMSAAQLRQLEKINARQNRVRRSVISSGYYPTHYRSLYDETGHNCGASQCDGTGQTIGLTLWGAGTTQSTLTSFATNSGDTPISLDTTDGVTTGSTGGTCVGAVAAGKPQAGKVCDKATVGADQIMYILEGGNPNTDFTPSDETSLDIEFSHGMAPHAGLKYYLAKSSAGAVTNADLLTAISDAANDTVVHVISDSWGGTDINGSQDPWYISTDNDFALAAAAGTTFYFSSGDQGSTGTGDPNDSRYVVSVGGTTLYNTSTSAAGSYSTETVWGTQTQDGEGSFCAASKPRPSWQNGISALANCPGRQSPDLAANGSSDALTHVYYSTSATATSNGGFLGTSISTPVVAGMMATMQNYIKAQTYSGSPPLEGFTAPTIYQMGESRFDRSYFHQVQCGNNATQIVNQAGTVTGGGPDGDSATEDYSPAVGFGSPDWFTFSQGYAINLGATNLSQPSDINPTYNWTCERQPMGQILRSVTCPSSSVCFGTAGSNIAWQPYLMGFYISSTGIQMQSATENQTIETNNGGASWFTTNSDMISSACLPGTGICVSVGDGGVIKRSTDGGTTWNFVNSPVNRPLTSVSCPTSTTCYAAGDVGEIIKSTNAGAGWAWTSTTTSAPASGPQPNPPGGDGNPFLGISCPSATTCYAVDILGQVNATTDGGASWTQQPTPIFNAGSQMLTSISCPTTTSCVAVGMDPATGTHPVIWTTNGGTTWNSGTSGVSGTATRIWTVSCAPGTTTCYEGQGSTSAIRKSTNLGASWAATGTTGGTGVVRNITCPDASTCYAAGGSSSGYVVRTTNGGTSWSAVTGLGSYLEGVGCSDATHCVASGWQGSTYATANGSSWTKQAGGGTTSVQNGISCMTSVQCVEVGASGSVLLTTNGGMTWNAQTSNAGSNALNAVSCGSSSNCVAVGAAGTVIFTADGGATWTAGTSGIATAINGVACYSSTSCILAGASGAIRTTANGGSSWVVQTSNTANALNAVSCSSSTLCVAAGASGTVDVSTNGGTTWTVKPSGTAVTLNAAGCLKGGANCYAAGAQGVITASTDGAGNTWALQGNPISGPTTALNVSAANTVQQGAGCSATSCYVVGSQGQLLTNPRPLVVLVNASAPYGTDPTTVLASMGSGSSPITYSPLFEGASGAVSGTVNCITAATSSSGIGVYPLTSCTGLGDANGRPVLYDLKRSSYTVTPTVASISIDAPTLSQTYNGSPRVVTATTSPAGLNYGVTYNGTGTAPVNAGSYPVVATVNDPSASNTPSDSQTLVVSKADQTISFGALADHTYGDADFNVSATASSGLGVSFAAGGSCIVAGATVHITGAGSCSITASQGGDPNWNAASDVTRSFDVAKADQMISFGAISDKTFGDPSFGIVATSTSGLPVSLTVTSGPCSLDAATSPANVTITGGGTCVITASQTGDSNYNAADDVVRSFAIAKANQTIDFSSLSDMTYGDADFDVSAATSSGLDVSFAAGPGSQCEVAGTTVHVTASGSCTVIASQTGDDNYNPAPDVAQSFNIAKSDQTISFSPLPDKTYGDADFTVSASVSSGLDVSFVTGAGDQCTITGTTVHVTAAGSCTITASQAGDSNYKPADDVSETFAIDKADQSIDFGSLSDKAWGDSDFNVNASATSGLDVSFSTSGDCSNSGNSIHIINAGSCTITASQGGDDNYNAAPVADQTFTINRADQTTSFGALPDKTFGDADFVVSAVATSGLDVTFSTSGSCNNTGSTVELTGSGICTVTASQPGDIDWNAASDVQQSFMVNQYAPVLLWTNPTDITYPTALDATQLDATSDVAGTFAYSPSAGTILGAAGGQTLMATFTPTDTTDYVDGGTVTASINVLAGTPNLSWTQPADITYGMPLSGTQFDASADVSGTFDYGPPAGTILDAGPNQTLTATFTPDDATDYVSGRVVQTTINVNQADQTIAFDPLAAKTWGDDDFTIGATASSGLAVTFSASGDCTVSSYTVHILQAGSCDLTAHQNGDHNYNAASAVTQTLTINKANQTITFGAIADGTFGDPSLVLSGSATSGLPVTFMAGPASQCYLDSDGLTLELVGAGSCTVTASQGGDHNYNAASDVTHVFSIAKADQTITFAALPNKTYGDSSFIVNATATSGLSVSFSVGVTDNCTISGNTVHITGAGSCTVTASQPGNTNYNAAADVSRSFSIAKADQTINFAPLADRSSFLDPDFPLTATASSGLPVTYGASGACSIAGGNMVHLVSSGTCTVTAKQVGNQDYNAAPNVVRSFNIGLADDVLTSTAATQYFAQGGTATVAATLTRTDSTPIVGRSITITVGPNASAAGNSCTGSTNGSGVASCSFTVSAGLVPQGANAVTDRFTADGFYKSNTNTQSAMVYAMPAIGLFVIGDKSSTGSVNWWGSQWAKNNMFSGGSAPNSMKGFANTVSAPRSCGSTFTTDTGGSSTPPASVPTYMVVAVSGKLTQSGSTIGGSVSHIVIVKTDAGYANDPGHPGTGTVVGQVC